MAECRGMFGVCITQNADDTKQGHRMTPFNYTGKKVIGPVTFQKVVALTLKLSESTISKRRTPHHQSTGKIVAMILKVAHDRLVLVEGGRKK